MQRILLADDNPGLRSALRLLLETRLEFELIVEARDMEHVLAQVEDSRPNIIILDWELPGRPIRERVSVLRTLVPHLKVIAFSARPESRQTALADGAEAFISKNEPPLLILDKIQKVFQQKDELTKTSTARQTCPLDQGPDCTTEGGDLGEQTV
ncbi:MAG TPA: response regulator transcription factor [Anaerolineales bacterium]|nr:response regulator transcription factor [Anaerolineales bacterium]